MERNWNQRRSLGRGLDTLLGTEIEESKIPSFLPIHDLTSGHYQPRKYFSEDQLNALVESIKERGLLQPILVRPLKTGRIPYEIVAGERRWKAAQKAGLKEVPVVIKELTDQEALEAALIENIQRENLTPIEEAEGYKRLLEEFQYTQEELAKSLGKSRSHIANMIRLLDLPSSLKEMLEKGLITVGHARALLSSRSPEEFAHQVVARGLNVRQTELLVKGELKPKASQKSSIQMIQINEEVVKTSIGDYHSLNQEEEWADLKAKLEECWELPVDFLEKEGRRFMKIEITSMEKFDNFLSTILMNKEKEESVFSLKETLS